MLAAALGSNGLDAGELGQDHAVAVGPGDRGAFGGGGEDVGDQPRRRARGGLAAGQRVDVLLLAGRAAAARSAKVEAAVELGDEADRRACPAASTVRVGGPVGGDAVADLGERDHRRRVDLVDAQGRQAAAGELDQVGLLADVGLERGVAERRVVGDAAAWSRC